ncbi:tRNA (N(6)-L-threonylcarbamoyladenosine(37)-C(2))-methylthiotransferase MtaB [Pelagibius sp. 7325]|uniref:tRNA (N(6)-L-threonylcarbamoyladenosine(37)-C(2))- methylthiotransferase MtaB n=1 Tax=Pelagibius sp. 7325 TaxID=3131994 RepID=UPI0030EE1011
MSAHPTKSPRILTFGCRLNAYESEVMRGHAEAAGLGDAIIVNTCAVTGEAERQARQAIRKARRENPGAQIIVTGCAAQIDPQGFAAMAEVDRVIGNEEKLKPESFDKSFLTEDLPRVLVNDIMAVTETAPQLIDGFAERTRAFVQVQQGCDHRCTFCIIPYGRGNSRSVPLGEVVRQVRSLVEQGTAEVVLTGVDVTSYGGDLPGTPKLGQMLRRLLSQVPDLKRLRLSSLDAIELDPDLTRLLAEEPRLMPHLHLSLQAGDDMILKRMKRRHSRREAVDLCNALRELRPDIVFGADLIAGFPTETEAMFENSLKLIEDCGLTYLHVFPYSARKGTPAAKMPQVPGPVRKQRAARLRAAGEAALGRFLDAQLGRTASVLIEKQEADGRWFGRSETFAPVLVNSGVVGAVIEVTITGRDGDSLVAVPLQHKLSPAA